MHCLRFFTTTLSLLVVSAGAFAQTFGDYENFPAPAANAFGVVGTALEDGRLLVWNGDTLFLQFTAGADSFSAVATGYAGDPAFIIPFLEGNEFLLGAGFGGNLYRFNLNAPVDYESGSEVANLSHFAAAFLSNEVILLDVGTLNPETLETGSELVTLDLSGSKAVVQPLVTKGSEYFAGPQKDIEKPTGAYSSSVFSDTANGFLYAMDGNTTELRRFSLSALLNAHNTSADLDWATDGTLVGNPGDFLSGGVSAIDISGNLVLAGFGGIQFVNPSIGNPALASVVDTQAPAGAFEFYSVIYNAFFDSIITRTFGGTVQTDDGTLVDLPAATLIGLGLLAAMIGGMGVKKTRS